MSVVHSPTALCGFWRGSATSLCKCAYAQALPCCIPVQKVPQTTQSLGLTLSQSLAHQQQPHTGCLEQPGLQRRSDGHLSVLGWEGAARSPGEKGTESPNHSRELGRSPFVFQGAANSCWSQDLLVRQEEPWGDDLNVYVYRNV